MDGVVFKKLPKGQVSFEVTVPVEELAPAEARALSQIGSELELKGFRKGKAPAELVRKNVSDAHVLEEMAHVVMEEKYPALIKEYGVRPAGRPNASVQKLARGNPFVFTLTVAVYPEVTLPDYKKIAESLVKERVPVLVGEKDVADAFEWLRQSRRKEELVSRPVKEGDVVEVDFESRIAGVKLDGGESRNHPFIVGKSSFAKGFDEQVVGMEPGSEKSFTLDIPADHARAEIRGKKVDFKVKLNSIKEVTLPDIDDAFAQSLGGFADKAALETNIREGLMQEKEEKEKESFRTKIAEAIAEKTKADIADVLIDQETAKMRSEMEHGLSERGLTLDSYLTAIKKTPEDFMKEVRAQAEKRVTISLVLEAIADKEAVTVSEAELKERMERYIARFDERQRKTIDLNALSQYVTDIMRNEKVFALLEKKQ